MKLKSICLYITTRCNLKCKRCLIHEPYLSKQDNISFEQVEETLIRIFEIADFIELLTVSGGEPLLYPELDKLFKLLWDKYNSKIKRIEFFTNGTIIPDDTVLKEVEKWGRDRHKVFIDNYGSEISTKVTEIADVVNRFDINYEIRNYNAEEAHCGGWVDFGDLRIKKYNYKEESKQSGFKHRCVYIAKGYRAFGIYKGVAYCCTQARMQKQFGFGADVSSDCLDLFDKAISLDEKRKWFASKSIIPFYAACDYCNGMCDDSERYVPAEQLTAEELKLIRAGARSVYELEEMKNQK